MMPEYVIARICEHVKSMGIGEPVEEVCRIAVANEMADKGRLLYDYEVMPIVADIVDGETVPQAKVGNDGKVHVSSAEWPLIPKDMKVVDTDGEQAMVIAGTVRKVDIFEDSRARDISAKIAQDIEDAWNFEVSQTGYDMDFDSYHGEIPDWGFECAECGSANQTVVWCNEGVCLMHCNDCDCEYEVGPECAPCYEHVYPLIEGREPVDGIVVFDDDGCSWGISDDGEIICEDDAEDPEEAHLMFDKFMEAEDKVEAGVAVKPIDGSEEKVIAGVFGRTVLFEDGTEARKAKVACDIMLGKVIADRSGMFEFDAEVGDVYENAKLESMEVTAVADGDVYWYDYAISKSTGDYAGMYLAASKQEFMERVVSGGYAK